MSRTVIHIKNGSVMEAIYRVCGHVVQAKVGMDLKTGAPEPGISQSLFGKQMRSVLAAKALHARGHCFSSSAKPFQRAVPMQERARESEREKEKARE